jgi:16S rRNA (guanine(527)-N(7))-methyltransferase RsmG
VTSLEFRDKLARRTRRAKAPVTLAMLNPLEGYFRLLAQWNAKINLTALPLDNPTDETFDRLLVEPLAAARQIPIHQVLTWIDLGSGGGSPAVPLKIARPSLSLTMVEAKERKGAFLREAIRVLDLKDACVETCRFETLVGDERFEGNVDLLTVRAVRVDSDLLQAVGSFLKPGGHLLLFRPPHSPSGDPPGLQRVTTVPLLDHPPSFLSVYKKLFHVEH